ncbi:MAG TPA: class I SAM-dependent methyltransferase [Rhizomicrobium sp.]|nr:class I SAM-dependent methyltransferase [Rhizomicrobium sp.]
MVGAIAAQIAGHDTRVLLLGVTPELCGIAQETVAVDHSANMIARVWPGDTPSRKAVLADWRSLPAVQPDFSAAIGDGSLNAVSYADYPAVFAQLARVLATGARIAFRVYETPQHCETIAQLRDDVMAGRERRFHAFKWRLAMALASERQNPDLPVALIYDVFSRVFADSEALLRATGWSGADLAEMEAYRGRDTKYSFPTRREILAAMPAPFTNARFPSSGSYALAERCPIFAADFTP